jgi:hypothetical protein
MRLQLAPLKPREVSRLARVDTMEKELPRVVRPLGRSNWVKQLAIADGSAKEKSSGSAEGKNELLRISCYNIIYIYIPSKSKDYLFYSRST